MQFKDEDVTKHVFIMNPDFWVNDLVFDAASLTMLF